MMTIVGNPIDYLIIFGGTSVEYLSGADTDAAVFKIKETLSDFWVFNVRNKLWQPLFPNSEDNPEPTEMGTLISFKADRLAMMYGGQYGEMLREDLWTYNINTNLWQRSYIADKSHKKPEFFYKCRICDYCAKCEKEKNIPDAELPIYAADRARLYCRECEPCQTTDKENENLSMYKLIDPAQTDCGQCEMCIHFTDEELAAYEALGFEEIIPKFEKCEECTLCTDCRNGIGLESPPGLRGHTMI